MNLFTKIILTSLCLGLAAASAQAAGPSIRFEMDGEAMIITYTGTLYQSADGIHWEKAPYATSPYLAMTNDRQMFFCSGGQVPEPKPGEDFVALLPGGVELALAWIAPGSFIMGSPVDEVGRDMIYDETQHPVTLTKGFWMGQYEVTQAQYESVMETDPSQFRGVDHPVDSISWNDAKAFCEKLNEAVQTEGLLPEGYKYALPTEAQWEYACRAGTTTALNNGKDLSDEWDGPEIEEVGWYLFNSGAMSQPVGQKQPNAWGLYDMHGNVFEWCTDWFAKYPAGEQTDPMGAETGENKVMRGGSWDSVAGYCRSAFRRPGAPDVPDNRAGLRLILVKDGAGQEITIPLAEGVELEIVEIKAGTFIMGSPEDEPGRQSNEVQHQVTLTQDYWMGKYEVTQAQYEAIMGTNPSDFKGADRPVEMVSWNDAMEFCKKLTEIEKAAGRLPGGYEYTLPTEAQWEYACRAGTTTALNSGKNLSDTKQCPEMDEVGWYGYNSDKTTHPVGEKKPNAWGLYDMHGNVYEWCLERYGNYPTSAVTDHTGASTGSYRVLRGGSWN
ncbi:MAG: formylglycine-generating enzyme family protein, partial [Verrucomicrobia bacterium]|nr:formylglycine-generating enzyme family protein [Verrucomicrobiota bacterium]